MKDQTVKQDPDRDCRIKGDRPTQIRVHVREVNKLLNNEERVLLKMDDSGAVGRMLYQIRRSNEQMLIIADELERCPDAGVFAQRIIDEISNRGYNSLAPHMYPCIIEILNDPYAHLDTVQREAIRDRTADVYAAGSGNTTMPVDVARGQIVDWSIEQMIKFVDNPDIWLELDFDPRTGEPWQNDS